MAGLASRWADSAPLVDEALHQDKSKDKPRKSEPKPAKLVSKWATDKPEESPEEKARPKARLRGRHRRNSLDAQHKAYPTPPTTAEGREKTAEKQERHDRSDKDKGDKHRRQKSHDKKELSPDRPMSEAASVLAGRLGMPRPTGPKGRAKSPLRAPKKNRERRDSVDRRDERRDRRDSVDKADRSPMTPAGQALAMRIGPAQPEDDGFVTTDEEDDKPSYAQALRTKSKYLTPKQKRELKEQEKRAKVEKEKSAKEEQLKAEVQAMFDKMGDKTTNWADIDWADEE